MVYGGWMVSMALRFEGIIAMLISKIFEYLLPTQSRQSSLGKNLLLFINSSLAHTLYLPLFQTLSCKKPISTATIE